jgi:hypothetical protein
LKALNEDATRVARRGGRAIHRGKKGYQHSVKQRFRGGDSQHLRAGFTLNFLEVLVKDSQINMILKNSLTSHFNRID